MGNIFEHGTKLGRPVRGGEGGGCRGCDAPPKSAKRSTFSHKVYQKLGFCRRVKGGWGSKSLLFGSKRSTFLGSRTPTKSILATGLILGSLRYMICIYDAVHQKEGICRWSPFWVFSSNVLELFLNFKLITYSSKFIKAFKFCHWLRIKNVYCFLYYFLNDFIYI